MKIIEKTYDNKRKYIKYNIFGLLKFNIKDNCAVLEEKLENLYTLMTENMDITKLSPAKGELRQTQLFLNNLLKRFKDICEKNNIKNWWLDSGTLLGAVRHKGFIPWDSDIDLCMLREDYNKLLPILEEEFKDDEIFFVRQRAITMNNFQIRIRAKERNLGLDVFPVDKYFKSELTEEEKAEVTRDIKHATDIFNKRFNKKRMTVDEEKYAKKEMLKIQNEVVMKNKKEEENKPALFFAIDFPCDARGNLIMDNKMILPLGSLSFEGEKYPVPNNYHEYLTNFYGNYMEFPSSIRSLYKKD